MQHFQLHEEFYAQPIRLNDEKPAEVLENFFSAYSLSEIRQHLWNMVEASTTTDNHLFDESRERDNLIWFYSQIEELIEAAYMLTKKESIFLICILLLTIVSYGIIAYHSYPSSHPSKAIPMQNKK